MSLDKPRTLSLGDVVFTLSDSDVESILQEYSKMKKLQWVEEDPENEDREYDWYAPGTPYTCVSDGAYEFAYYTNSRYGSTCLGMFDDVEQAKEACQAHADTWRRTQEWLQLPSSVRAGHPSPLRELAADYLSREPVGEGDYGEILRSFRRLLLPLADTLSHEEREPVVEEMLALSDAILKLDRKSGR